VAVGEDHEVVAGPEALALATASPNEASTLCRDLKSRLTRDQINIGDRTVAPVAALAALLARLANQAHRVTGLPVAELVLTMPASWGPRHRAVLHDAAHRAGLPAPQLIPIPVAAGWFLIASGTPVPPGSMLLVCDAGHAAFETTLLVRTTTGYATLATARATDAAGHTVQERLAEHCLTQLSTVDADLAGRLRQPQTPTDRRDRMVFDRHIHAARRTLATTASPPTIPVPAPYPPIPVSRNHYHQIAVPVAAQCADTASGVLDAAGTGPTPPAQVCCIGGSLTTETLDALRERGLAPQPVTQPELTALLGAADTPTAGAPTPPRQRTGPPWQTVPGLTALVTGGCAAALAGHALYSSTATGFYHNIPQINWGEYAMACCCALLATTAAAEAPARPPSRPRSLPNLFQVPRLAYAALAGLLAAVGVALAGITSVALPWSMGTYLAWAILPILLLAALAATAGVLTQHDPRHARSVEATRLRVVPAEGVAAAAVGMMLLQIPLMGADHPLAWYTLMSMVGPDAAQTVETLLGHLGALGIAAGTALIAATTLRARLAAVPIAAAVGGLIQPFGLTTPLGLAFVAAATFWWARRTLRLLITLAPQWHHLSTQPRTGLPQIPGTPLALEHSFRPTTSMHTPPHRTVGDRYGR
jgi:hypothetical protein